MVNRAELAELCYYDSYKASTHGLLHKTKTRRGTRAGSRYKKRFSEVKRVKNVGQSTQRKRGQLTSLPSKLYTNCRALTQWKVDELLCYADLHKPDFICCLNETWLNEDKEKARQLEGYNNFFCHRKNRPVKEH